jgi:segregation and condensation protein A
MMETQQDHAAGYQIHTPLFEGPLDLLLQLVRRYEINIYDIPITLITEQFMQYIALMERLDLEIASEFIVMAAHLCVIKSRMLLPHDTGEDDEEDPRSELVAQLLEYQKFKAAAQILEESEGISLAILERRAGQIVFDFPGDENNWVDVKLFDLVGAFSRIMARAAASTASTALAGPAAPVYPEFRDVEDDYDPEEKIAQITTLLDIRNQVDFEDIITPDMRRGEIIIIFFAILDMIKRGLILVRQHRLFGDITILKRGSSL